MSAITFHCLETFGLNFDAAASNLPASSIEKTSQTLIFPLNTFKNIGIVFPLLEPNFAATNWFQSLWGKKTFRNMVAYFPR